MIIGFYHDGEKMYAIVDPSRSADLMYLRPKGDKPKGNSYVPVPSVDVELTEAERKAWVSAQQRRAALTEKIRIAQMERELLQAGLHSRILKRISR
jgi:hypothetical protein